MTALWGRVMHSQKKYIETSGTWLQYFLAFGLFLSAANLITQMCDDLSNVCAKYTIVLEFFSMCEYLPEKFRNFGQMRKVSHQN